MIALFHAARALIKAALVKAYFVESIPLVSRTRFLSEGQKPLSQAVVNRAQSALTRA